jgi:hypothetical protein
MKYTKIAFWFTTGILFLTQGIMPILTTNMPESKAALAHLGYPSYFGILLAVFKFLGGIALIFPKFPNRIKEWAYAGFAIDFIVAFVSLVAADGLNATSLFPVIAIILLTISYITYHKLFYHKNII